MGVVWDQCVKKTKKSLVCVAEPQSGFSIAFNMFDTDGDQRVDKREFLVVIIICVLHYRVSNGQWLCHCVKYLCNEQAEMMMVMIILRL